MAISNTYDTDLTERVAAFPDAVFNATALPNAGSIESGVFRFGKTQGQIELAMIANTEIVVADGETMSIEAFWDKSKDGDFTSGDVMFAAAPTGMTLTIPAGTEFDLNTPETNYEHWVKIKITCSANQSAQKVDGKLFRTAV